ncbi:D-alanyl-D-alanine carboxypeptidase family protein [Gracilibacillus alcaliphilus]|uniref:D-alanyl-D-alanine carboxypeptidase family protein n=1 Tax=Gracilibacillus alcaliphilus TaxID=1401441 RepID=UPI00195C7D90|nr:D-alanyl-D-alanine carboxypeptidase family protein [Gracilibacillus alcaliphilus]MBM7678516.1 D-alanyl-D-alanine carboxypeptidase (penicillin-binding protein 5/6) [Gracilibacillus alcaliphilus]
MKKRLLLIALLLITLAAILIVAFDFKPKLAGSLAAASEKIRMDYQLPDEITDRFWVISDIELEAETALLIDAESGHILYESNSDQAVPTASMSKMMTELLVLEAIEAGQINWEDEVTVSDYALAISNHPGFASVGLREDETYTVRELFAAMAIHSANGATIALAETVSGSEKEFVQAMNQKAAELGLEQSSFVNSSGLDNHLLGEYYSTGSADDTNTMSANDLASLAVYLLQQFPEVLEVMKQADYIKGDQSYPNTNRMLQGELAYNGVGGLKTGYTDIAGYCFTGTVERDGIQLISVVTGTSSEMQRFADTAALYDEAFALRDNW